MFSKKFLVEVGGLLCAIWLLFPGGKMIIKAILETKYKSDMQPLEMYYVESTQSTNVNLIMIVKTRVKQLFKKMSSPKCWSFTWRADVWYSNLV